MTACHKHATYRFEQYAGMLLFRRVGRSKVYRAQCSQCGKAHDLKEREAINALSANNAERHQ